ncbi:MAG TPA: cysteine--tRNA ligase [Herpetosiphonaceae bacterium]|nr:cysteine--tRNA ligase [Herpetosiphonaceae bacterium]
MALKIYNTLTRQTLPFAPLRPDEVSMYVCGPTVYSDAHIGHAMSALVFDVVRRYLEWSGFRVRHVMNFTDVDDKIIKRANEQGRDPMDLANAYAETFLDQLRQLNILPATAYPRVSTTMPQIIEFIEGLIAKEAAYAAPNGDVYFSVRGDDDYGKLSRRAVDDMRSGARIAPGEDKDDPLDFALWKAAKPGEPSWDSPWGQGRPGWHIECSAMSYHEIGSQIDIHGGGNDLIFPHHENEIAQTESLTGTPFAQVWMHNGMLQLAGEKMSKSLGNLVTIEEFLGGYSADIMRLLVLSSSYRAPLTYTDEVLADTERKLDRLLSALRPATGDLGEGPAAEALAAVAAKTREGFKQAMDDDFNTASALASLFDLVRAINTARDAGLGGAAFAAGQETLRELAGVLGLRLEIPAQAATDAAPFIELLIELRADLRKAKQWQLADQVRDKLAALGVTLEDGAGGTTYEVKRIKDKG